MLASISEREQARPQVNQPLPGGISHPPHPHPILVSSLCCKEDKPALRAKTATPRAKALSPDLSLDLSPILGQAKRSYASRYKRSAFP